jgi:hypothetical protein
MKEIRVTKEIGLPKEIRLTTKIISPFARSLTERRYATNAFGSGSQLPALKCRLIG